MRKRNAKIPVNSTRDKMLRARAIPNPYISVSLISKTEKVNFKITLDHLSKFGTSLSILSHVSKKINIYLQFKA
jgi:hypothetical protein